MRVLLVEDDSATAQSIELMLKSEGMNVYTTDLGEEGVDLARIYDYDIMILDLNLPDMNGLEVLRQIRVGKINTPVLILTGEHSIEVKVKAFSGGADDYMTKPFHRDELVARIHAIVRRSKGHAQSIIVTGAIAVNLDAKTVEVHGRRVHLTGKEYQMMELLALRKGTTLTKEMFLNHLYGGMDEPELNIVGVFMCKLRKKIANANDGKHHIETVWGRGYQLTEPKPDSAPAVCESPHLSVVEAFAEEAPQPIAGQAAVFEETPRLTVVDTVADKAPRQARSKGTVVIARIRLMLVYLELGNARAKDLLSELQKVEPAATIVTVHNAISAATQKGYMGKIGDTFPLSYQILGPGRDLIAQAA